MLRAIAISISVLIFAIVATSCLTGPISPPPDDDETGGDGGLDAGPDGG